MKNRFIIFLFLFLLTSCKPSINLKNFTSADNNSNSINESEIKIDDILKAQKLVALGNNNSLYLIDPDFANPLEIYQFEKNDEPTRKNIDSFEISPNNEWIVWYSPIKGIIGLNVKSKEIKLIHEATDFLNTFPYFQFVDRQTLMFITDNGNNLQVVSLDDMSRTSNSIPYPYGNVFKVSPDEKNVLFISGYGQAQQKPKFMFTNINGNYSNQFSTNTNLFDRNLVFWAPDSNGVLMINESNLEYYPLINPEKNTVMFGVGKENKIINAQRIGNSVFIYSNDGYWHVYDFESQKEIARTPVSIAGELNNPKFIPWSAGQFLIEEDLKDNDVQFNRLWISDFRGNKKILMEEYNKLIIEVEILKVN